MKQTIRDSYGSTITFEFVPDDGESPAAVEIAIAHPSGNGTNVQFIGEGGVARVLESMAAFVGGVRS